MRPINRIQELNLQLIESASFNNFDGSRVASDLRFSADAWHGAVMKRDVFAGKVGYRADLIDLRDIEGDFWNVDTLYLYVDAGFVDSMKEIADQWNADEVEVLGLNESFSMLGCGDNTRRVIRVWWD